jgi:transposase InsO family protein
VSIGSDNGPAFVAEVVQLVAKGLGITWKLHMAYCSQSSGKVEHMYRTLNHS